MRLTAKERETEELAEKVREHLSYDASTGVLYRIRDTRWWKGGQIETGIRTDSDGCTYKQVGIGGEKVMAHRLAWLLYYKEWPDGQLDHQDGNGLNNRIDNLRCVTNMINAMNQKKNKRNTSGFVGVRKHAQDDRWQARIYNNGEEVYLGIFKTKEQAVEARRIASIKFGYHPNHGRSSAVESSITGN